jgi:Family of unknown function (DUF6152)
MQRRFFSVVAACALLGVATRAHHSISAVYDDTQSVTIEGIVTQFQFVNPHPLVVMDVKDSAGNTQQWRLEMDTHRELADIGFTSDSLKPGERLMITGSRARRQPQSLYIRRLERPSDGFAYEQVGNSPRLLTPAPRPSTGPQH